MASGWGDAPGTAQVGGGALSGASAVVVPTCFHSITFICILLLSSSKKFPFFPLSFSALLPCLLTLTSVCS